MPGLGSAVGRGENGSFILALWLGQWEVPGIQEQRTVGGIELLVGHIAHPLWLPVDLGFPLLSSGAGSRVGTFIV